MKFRDFLELFGELFLNHFYLFLALLCVLLAVISLFFYPSGVALTIFVFAAVLLYAYITLN